MSVTAKNILHFFCFIKNFKLNFQTYTAKTITFIQIFMFLIQMYPRVNFKANMYCIKACLIGKGHSRAATATQLFGRRYSGAWTFGREETLARGQCGAIRFT